MSEATKTRAALDDVKRQWPSAVIYKFNDRRTKGIPDALVVSRGAHVWLEFKDVDKLPNRVGDLLSLAQRVEVGRLIRQGSYVGIVVFVGRDTFCYQAVPSHDDYFQLGSPHDYRCSLISFLNALVPASFH